MQNTINTCMHSFSSHPLSQSKQEDIACDLGLTRPHNFTLLDLWTRIGTRWGGHSLHWKIPTAPQAKKWYGNNPAAYSTVLVIIEYLRRQRVALSRLLLRGDVLIHPLPLLFWHCDVHLLKLYLVGFQKSNHILLFLLYLQREDKYIRRNAPLKPYVQVSHVN